VIQNGTIWLPLYTDDYIINKSNMCSKHILHYNIRLKTISVTLKITLEHTVTSIKNVLIFHYTLLCKCAGFSSGAAGCREGDLHSQDAYKQLSFQGMMLQGRNVLKFLATKRGNFTQNFQAGVLIVPVNLPHSVLH